MRVEVEDDALQGLGRRDDPAAVLVRRVLQWVARGGDVAGFTGIEIATAWLRRCVERERKSNQLKCKIKKVKLKQKDVHFLWIWSIIIYKTF